MRLNLKQKMDLIKQGKAYVEKADGAFFLYITMNNNTQIAKKLTRKDFEELEYWEWQVESDKQKELDS